jgi:membrane-associated phospholipid phosphatase
MKCRPHVVVLSLLLTATPAAFAAKPTARPQVHKTLAFKPARPTKERSQESFARRVRSDLAALLSRPAHMRSRDWERLGIGVAAVGSAATLDNELQTRIQRHRTSSSDSLANAIRPAGGWGALGALGVTWLVGEAGHNPNLKATAEDGLEASLIAGGLITPALKIVVGRARPAEGVGASSFHPFSHHYSFPSGEATEAFAVASVVSAHTHSLLLKGAVWGLAGAVGWERMDLNRHWSSDVVAGALIGAEVGHWVVARHERRAPRMVDVVIVPTIAPGAYGVSGDIAW